MRTQIHVRITDDKNVTEAAFTVFYPQESQLDEAVDRMLPVLGTKGMFVFEHLTYDLALSGISIQKLTKPKAQYPDIPKD